MFRLFMALVAVVALVAVSSDTVYAQGGRGGGGSGGGKGGSTKPVIVRWTGTITAITPVSGGWSVTVGTSYYATGTGIANSETRIKLNGDSNVSISDLRVGDYAEMDVYWPSKIIKKMEVTGTR